MDARRILEDAYVLGFDVLPSLALGLASLEDILKEYTSPLLLAMYDNTKKLRGDYHDLQDNQGLEEKRMNFFKKFNITEKAFQSSYGGLLEVRKKEGKGPVKILPSVMPYNKKIEERGRELLGYLQENFLLVNKWTGFIFKMIYKNGKVEYLIIRRPVVHLIWKEGNDLMDKSLFLDVIPSVAEGVLNTSDEIIDYEYRRHLLRWVFAKNLMNVLGMNPWEIVESLLNKDKRVIDRIKDEPYSKELMSFLEHYWKGKGNLAYRLGLLFESYNPSDLVHLLNEANEPWISDPIERARFAKDITSVFRNIYSRILIIPKGLLDRYINAFDRMYDLLNGGYDPEARKITKKIEKLEKSSRKNKKLLDLYNKLYDKISFAVPVQALWIVDPEEGIKRFGHRSFSEIGVYVNWDGQEYFL